MNIRIPLSPEHHTGNVEYHIEVGPEASTIVILGVAGTGKSVLAMLLAQQALADGGSAVHYLNRTDVLGELRPDSPRFHRDSAMQLLAQLAAQHPNRVFTHDLPRDGSPAEVVGAPPAGSMVILDETRFFHRAQTEMLDWMQWASAHGYLFVVTGQTPEDVFPPLSADEEKKGVKHIGAMFLGRLNKGPTFDRAPQSVQAVMEATQLLRYDWGPSRDFIVATTAPDWMGVARYTVSSAMAE